MSPISGGVGHRARLAAATEVVAMGAALTPKRRRSSAIRSASAWASARTRSSRFRSCFRCFSACLCSSSWFCWRTQASTGSFAMLFLTPSFFSLLFFFLSFFFFCFFSFLFSSFLALFFFFFFLSSELLLELLLELLHLPLLLPLRGLEALDLLLLRGELALQRAAPLLQGGPLLGVLLLPRLVLRPAAGQLPPQALHFCLLFGLGPSQGQVLVLELPLEGAALLNAFRAEPVHLA
mmetsp:Transcript_33134/g.99795  ORF Transcript_33134/g.99795 Transcript_33134/m.99795 type:complete len:236 (+) Transcript_33134:521-1228(+)